MSEDSLSSPADAPARRRRAPNMAPEERRLQLIEAAIPLVHAHGSAVTTAQVAEAAGVAEGTIFRLFTDKESLLDNVLEVALDPEPVTDALALLSPELSLDERVRGAAEAMRLHFEHALPVMHGAMHHGRRERAGFAVGRMFNVLLDGAEALFREELARGRVHGEPRMLAGMLVGLCQSVAWQQFFERGAKPLPTADFVAVVLHGCAVNATSGSPTT